MRSSPRATWLTAAVVCLAAGSLAAPAPGLAAEPAAVQAPAATPSPAATPAPAPTPVPVIPKPRTLWKGDDGEVRLLNRVQLRWTDPMPDDKSVNVDSGGEFRIRRAKTEITGWVMNERLTYELQLSWAGPEPGASTQSALEDLVLSWDATNDGRLKITGGQFKVPLGRQEMTSSGRLQFLDRDILSIEFTRGRDIGLQLEGALAEGKFVYAAGIFNGNPASHLGNDNDKYQFNARAMFEPFGKVGYSESDFDSSDRPLLSIAAQFEHNDQRRPGTDLTPSVFRKSVIFGGDAVFKYKGFSLFAEMFLRELTPQQGPSYNSNGFHGQAGYFLLRDRLEAALRYASFDPTDAAPDNIQSEWGVALNYFIRKHGLKLQSDFREIENEIAGTKDQELRVQAQVMF